MIFLISQIIVFLVFAALLGVSVGWALTRNSFKQPFGRNGKKLREQLTELETERNQMLNELEELKVKYADLQNNFAKKSEGYENKIQVMETENHNMRHARRIILELQEESKIQFEASEEIKCELIVELEGLKADFEQQQHIIEAKDLQLNALNKMISEIAKRNELDGSVENETIFDRAGNFRKMN